ncbi:MAG: hypothetical protein ACT4O9_07450 [Blastocatellia bacterium]
MKTAFLIFASVFCTFQFSIAQTVKPGMAKPVPKAAQTPFPSTGISDRTYRNAELGFAVTFPETWQIAGGDFESSLKTQGFDLSLKAPDGIGGASRIQMDRALERVKVLVTAYRSAAASRDSAIVRISAEDLTLVPDVKDAVDYFDLMRSQFSRMKLPAGFTYSETQAEQLGKKQFAFLDVFSSAGKKRLYATVKGRSAILITISYAKDEDLQTLRRVLSQGTFR